MKKIILGFVILVFAFSFSCNNSGEKKNGKTNEKTKTRADSLMDDVMEGHNAGMGKMGKLSTMQNKVKQAIDSINKLPGKIKMTATDYKASLDALLTELMSAEEGMNKWMDEFNMDSAQNNLDQRIQYLESEKIKVTKVKESMLNALHKADSLLKH